jgi:exonuclease VII large subunit
MARRSHCDDAKMPDEPTPDMPDLSVRELKTEMDDRFHELKSEMDDRFHELTSEMDNRFTQVDRRFADVDRRFAEVDRRFDRLETHFEARLRAEHIETRRHFDIVAESLRSEIRLRLEGSDARLDNHERRIQSLEKRRR